MEVGAIIIVDTENGNTRSRVPENETRPEGAESFVNGPVGFVDLLGRSLVEHTIGSFAALRVRDIGLVVHQSLRRLLPGFRYPYRNLGVHIAAEVWKSVASLLESFSRSGIDRTFLVRPRAYTETDLSDFLEFHSQGDRPVTRASDPEGPLDIWVVDCDSSVRANAGTLRTALLELDFFAGSYFVREYVKRISYAEDFRHIVADAFQARCNLKPMGEQLRPGIWADQGSQVRRGARIVSPAYLGQNCVIGECALITRSSNVERGCLVDYGTAIENSSVLSDSYVGMWLDVRHSVVSGCKLLNLERNVFLELNDPSLLGSNASSGGKAPQMRGRESSATRRDDFTKGRPANAAAVTYPNLQE